MRPSLVSLPVSPLASVSRCFRVPHPFRVVCGKGGFLRSHATKLFSSRISSFEFRSLPSLVSFLTSLPLSPVTSIFFRVPLSPNHGQASFSNAQERAHAAAHSADHALSGIRPLRLLPRKRSSQLPLALWHASSHLLRPPFPSPEHSWHHHPGVPDQLRILRCSPLAVLGRRWLFFLPRRNQSHSRHGSRSPRRRYSSTLGRELRCPHSRHPVHLRPRLF